MGESTVESLSEVPVDMTNEAPIRVLHVDDEAGFLKSAKLCLEMQGAFEVETAVSVEEALEKMEKREFAAIVCDYVMPGKDGLVFLKELREEGNNIPFIIFTGKGREEVAIKALNLGADRYFHKIGPPETVYGELAHGIRRTVEERRAQMEVWRREERLRAILASSPDAIIISDLNANVVECNQATLKLTRHASKEEIIGRNSLEFIAEKDRNRALDNLKKTLERGTAKSMEYTLLKKDGEEYQGELSASVLKDSSGNPIGFVGVVRDITERKKAEEALRRSKEQLSGFMDSATDGFMLFDSKLNLVEINRSALRILGLETENVMGKNALDISPDTKETGRYDRYMEVIRTGEPFFVDDLILHPKFGKRHVALKAFKVGNGLGLIGTDITGRKKAEEMVRASEEKYRNIVELAPDGILTIDLKGKVTSCNTAVLRQSGYSRHEIVGKHFSRLPTTPVKDISKYAKVLKDIISGTQPKPFDFRWIHKDGTTRLGEIHISLMKKGCKTAGFQAIMRDITERKRNEIALRKSEERYRSVFESTREGIIIRGPDGKKITSANPAAARILGYKNPEELVGKSTSEMYVDQTQRKALLKELKDKGHVQDFDLEIKRKEGTHVYTLASIAPHKDGTGNIILTGIFRDITELKKTEEKLRESKGKYRELTESISDVFFALDKDFRYTYWNKASEKLTGIPAKDAIGKSLTEIFPDVKGTKIEHFYRDALRRKRHQTLVNEYRVGDEDFFFEIHAYPTKDGLSVFVKNITERKKAEDELKMTLEKLKVLNEKMSVVGKLTRHDVRNKLFAVANNVYLAKQRLTDDPEALEHLSEIESACDQIERIFDFARTYEKLGVEELTNVNVEKSVQEAASLFSDLHGVKIINDCHGLTVLADSLLRQLFYNLIDNSLKYGEKVSHIRVHYEKGKDKLKLVVEDDGVGIPKAEKEKIFNEGYGKGTGYGLYLVRKMCEVYGWTIQETGKHGKGAQFTITIPTAPAK